MANPPGLIGGLQKFTAVSTGSALAPALTVFDGPGQVFFISAGNINAAARFLKMFDVAQAQTPTSSITGMVPDQSFIIPGNTAGAGTNLGQSGLPQATGVQYNNGLAIAFSSAMALTGASGCSDGDCNVSIWYRK